jgi:DNA repair protein RadA/Sms
MKAKVKYVCSQCGYETGRWLGRCGQCGAWDSLEEVAAESAGSGHGSGSGFSHGADRQSRAPESLPVPMGDIDAGGGGETRIDMGMPEFNRVLGGGLTPGSAVLVAGDPGIGKSTLLLQAACKARVDAGKVWYVTGEESLRQVKARGDRMELANDQVLLWAQTDIDRVTAAIRRQKPSVVVVDSIQTMHTSDLSASPGSVS